MGLKNIVVVGVTCLMAVNFGITKENIKPPTYQKSSASTRYLKLVDMTATDRTNGLAKPGTTSLRSLVPDTLRIMGIRVQFQRDSDRNTSGDGWFELSATDSVMINPPPHDFEYFTNQLRALKHYFESVSSGKLILEVLDKSGKGAVYPQQADSVWTLPHPMAYYNPNTTDEALDNGLAELFRDAIMAADSDSDIDFSQFDVFIIFHAGVGWEFTQDFDTTPSDIPSVFLNLNDLKKNLGQGSESYQGIPVNGGAHFIQEGIILPETENQGGYTIFGMLGTAAIMMGHQLGLPNLFDTDTGHPGIGRFGLMDQGSGSFLGLIPVQPCAWSKVFLGWEQPIEVTVGTKLPVAASLARNPNKIYKIPINAKEYFLIENRQRVVLKSRDVAIGRDVNGVQVEFTNDGEINLPIGTQRLDVITSIDEYDFGMPSYDTGTSYLHSGILIWHIDENIIEQRFEENRVNADMYHRGVGLVEADGAQDMGHFYNFFGITGYESGGVFDMWWDQNSDHFFANSSEVVAFTPTTMPNSNAYSGAPSGIYMTDFSEIDSIMYFTLKTTNSQSGFPAFAGPNSGASSPVTGDVDGDGVNDIIAARTDGKILAWKFNGDRLIQNTDETYRVSPLGDTTYVSLAVFAEADSGHFMFAPSLADLNNDGALEVVAGADNGLLFGWHGVDRTGDGRADTSFIFDCGAPITTVPVISDLSGLGDDQEILVGLESGELCYFHIQASGTLDWKKKITESSIQAISIVPLVDRNALVVTTAADEVILLNANGDIVWNRVIPELTMLNHPAAFDLNNDGNFEIALSTGDGALCVLDNAGVTQVSFSVPGEYPLSNPVIGDVDNNGAPDIVVSGGGRLFAYHFNGTLLTGFPVLIERGYEQTESTEPILADLEGDGTLEILCGAKSGVLPAYDAVGQKVRDFPLSVSGEIVASPGIFGFTESGKFQVVARTADDYCYVWQLPYDYKESQIHWGGYLNNPRHTSLFQKNLTPVIKQSELLPEKLVYNYPNPTEGNSTTIRYYLREATEVSIRIYDLSGELVTELTGTSYPNVENEVVWDITNVQSGVYLARVAAESASESSAVIIKIAVVK